MSAVSAGLRTLSSGGRPCALTFDAPSKTKAASPTALNVHRRVKSRKAERGLILSMGRSLVLRKVMLRIGASKPGEIYRKVKRHEHRLLRVASPSCEVFAWRRPFLHNSRHPAILSFAPRVCLAGMPEGANNSGQFGNHLRSEERRVG